MAYKMVSRPDRYEAMTRFDARYWVVNFSRPMMSCITASDESAFTVSSVFYRKSDLVGVIWESADLWSHPACRYATGRDYRACRMSFRWKSTGARALDQINGPTLTIEGRDEDGEPVTYYVRLWNYATGTPEDAQITLDFDDLLSGYTLPDEGVPVWAGDIDRVFVSVVPPGYEEGVNEPLPQPVETTVEVTSLVVTGFNRSISLGVPNEPVHGLSMATGFDDSYNQTPARLVAAIKQLGYRGAINHYVGMSHYFKLAPLGNDFYVTIDSDVVNTPALRWHQDFVAKAKAAGFTVIFSLSYEIFNAHLWNDWKQRNWNQEPALTGWEPPSSLVSPCHADGINYLELVAKRFCQILADAAMPVLFQIGEPWWWVPASRVPYIFDPSTTAAYQAETGRTAPRIDTVNAPLSPQQLLYMDWLGTKLGQSTNKIRDAVRSAFSTAKVYLLFYAPQVLERNTETHRINLPVSHWSNPNYDILQLEDYDFVLEGREDESADAVVEVTQTLGYPAEKQDYFSGFILVRRERAKWREIDRAATLARRRGVHATYVWAYPQIARDGYLRRDLEVPAAPVWTVRPNWRHGLLERLEWLTDVLTSDTGAEQRRAVRRSPRRSFEMTVNPTRQERTYLDLLLHRLGSREWLFPLWHDQGALDADANSGQRHLSLDNTFREFNDDGYALIYRDAFSWEVVIVELQTADRLLLAKPLAQPWPKNAKVYPLRRALLRSDTSLKALTSRVGESALLFQINEDNNYPALSGDMMVVYDNAPLLIEAPNRSSDITADQVRFSDEQDGTLGLRYRTDLVGRAFSVRSHNWTTTGRQAQASFRSLLYTLAGRQRMVWLPTFNDDIILTRPVAIGATSMTFEAVGMRYVAGASPVPGRARLWSGNEVVRLASIPAPPAPGEERAVLTSPAARNHAPGASWSFLEAARLDTDVVEIKHHADSDGTAECGVTFRTFTDGRDGSGNNFLPIPTSPETIGACGAPAGLNPCAHIPKAEWSMKVRARRVNGNEIYGDTFLSLNNGEYVFPHDRGEEHRPFGFEYVRSNGVIVAWEWTFWDPIARPTTFLFRLQHSGGAAAGEIMLEFKTGTGGYAFIGRGYAANLFPQDFEGRF